MEQVLINELIKLLCKGGCEALVGNFQKVMNLDGHPEQWSETEIAEAIQYVRYINEFFGKDEAVAVVTSLVAKYNINPDDLALRPGLKAAKSA